MRQSTAGEKITLLDETQATLDDQTLVIADAKGAIAIAGVMGGADSAIDDSSKDIVLEAAHFTRKSASGAARRYGLHTESSHRFERGVDPMLAPQAMERATELLVEICGGEIGPVVEKAESKGLSAKPSVSIRLDRLKSLLGMELEEQEVDGILNRIADAQAEAGQSWLVTPPSYRFDIEREADLVEEVARVKGYDNIPTAMPRIAPRSVAASEVSIGARQVRQAFVARDYREAITYSFIDPKIQALFDDETPVTLANPLDENMSVMRTSLIPGLMNALQFNKNRQHDRIRFFEIGATYHKDGDAYKEKQNIAGVLVGPAAPSQWGVNQAKNVDFFDIKADLEAVLSLTNHKNPIIFNEFEHIALHPGQVSLLSRVDQAGNKIELGWLGRLHPTLEKHYGISNIYAFEIDLDKALLAELPAFSSVSKFPSVKRDLSVLIDNDIPVSDLLIAIKEELGQALINVEVFDVYRGQGIPEESKSISLSLVLQYVDKTMTDEDSEKYMNKALSILESRFEARLRS